MSLLPLNPSQPLSSDVKDFDFGHESRGTNVTQSPNHFVLSANHSKILKVIYAITVTHAAGLVTQSLRMERLHRRLHPFLNRGGR